MPNSFHHSDRGFFIALYRFQPRLKIAIVYHDAIELKSLFVRGGRDGLFGSGGEGAFIHREEADFTYLQDKKRATPIRRTNRGNALLKPGIFQQSATRIPSS